MTVTRDASRSDDRINSSQLNPATGHAPERVRWAHERDKHDAQKGVHGGMHLVVSPLCLVEWRCPRSGLGEPGHEDYHPCKVFFVPMS